MMLLMNKDGTLSWNSPRAGANAVSWTHRLTQGSTSVSGELLPAPIVAAAETIVCTRRGRLVAVRAVTPQDVDALADFLRHLSVRTLYSRYFSRWLAQNEEAIRREALRLAQGSEPHHSVMLAQSYGSDGRPIVAIAELAWDAQQPMRAEVGLVVADSYQRDGIGRALAARIVADAARRGVSTVHASVLGENSAIRRLIAGLGAPYTSEIREGVVTVQIDIAPIHSDKLEGDIVSPMCG